MFYKFRYEVLPKRFNCLPFSFRISISPCILIYIILNPIWSYSKKRFIKLALFLTCSFSCMQNGLSPCVSLVYFSCCSRLDTLLTTFCWFVKGLYTFFYNVNTMKSNYPTSADVSSLISHSWCSFVLRTCEAVCVDTKRRIMYQISKTSSWNTIEFSPWV